MDCCVHDFFFSRFKGRIRLDHLAHALHQRVMPFAFTATQSAA
jgi:hypothetical protein